MNETMLAQLAERSARSVLKLAGVKPDEFIDAEEQALTAFEDDDDKQTYASSAASSSDFGTLLPRYCKLRRCGRYEEG